MHIPVLVFLTKHVLVYMYLREGNPELSSCSPRPKHPLQKSRVHTHGRVGGLQQTAISHTAMRGCRDWVSDLAT